MSQDHDQNKEVKSPGPTVPVFFFILTALFLFGGAIYVDLRGGGFNDRVYAPYSSFDYVRSIQPGAGGDDDLSKGEGVYKLYCLACHQGHGGGTPGQFPPLAGSDWVNTEGPNRIIRIVLDGAQGPINVNGVTYSAMAMPPWKENLKDDDIAAVVTYIRNTWGNKGSSVKPAQVKAIREAEKARTGPWDPAKLLETPDK